MINLLADAVQAANTLDAESIGKLIAVLIGCGVLGGGSYLAGKAKKMVVTPDPLNIRKASEYATKEDIERLDKSIEELRGLQRDSEKNAHKRIDGISETLNQLDGKMDLLLQICKSTKCTK